MLPQTVCTAGIACVPIVLPRHAIAPLGCTESGNTRQFEYRDTAWRPLQDLDEVAVRLTACRPVSIGSDSSCTHSARIGKITIRNAPLGKYDWMSRGSIFCLCERARSGTSMVTKR